MDICRIVALVALAGFGVYCLIKIVILFVMYYPTPKFEPFDEDDLC